MPPVISNATIYSDPRPVRGGGQGILGRPNLAGGRGGRPRPIPGTFKLVIVSQ
jgi:hypothetical protein